jgi:hypothetical protein
MSLNDKITRMKSLRDSYRHLDAESKALKEEYKEIEALVMAVLYETEMTNAGNDVASVSMSEEDVPSVDAVHWEEVREWLVENDYNECFPKKLNSAPVRELWNMGVEIPHVTRFTKRKLSLTTKTK